MRFLARRPRGAAKKSMTLATLAAALLALVLLLAAAPVRGQDIDRLEAIAEELEKDDPDDTLLPGPPEHHASALSPLIIPGPPPRSAAPIGVAPFHAFQHGRPASNNGFMAGGGGGGGFMGGVMPATKLGGNASPMAAAAAAAAQREAEAARLDTVVAEDCDFSLGGYSFDLSELMLENGQPEYAVVDSRHQHIYKLNICGTATSPGSDCQRAAGSVCQYTNNPVNPSMEGVIARWSAQPQPEWGEIDEKGSGVKLSFKNGDDCEVHGRKKTREATIYFVCEEMAGAMGLITAQEVETCNYAFTIPTALACRHAGLSHGWVFIILFILAAGIYIGGGCLYNRKKLEKTGIDAMPHLEFWRELPGLVKDGVSYSWRVAKYGPLCKCLNKAPEEGV